jgi:hypothetical protein
VELVGLFDVFFPINVSAMSFEIQIDCISSVSRALLVSKILLSLSSF